MLNMQFLNILKQSAIKPFGRYLFIFAIAACLTVTINVVL